MPDEEVGNVRSERSRQFRRRRSPSKDTAVGIEQTDSKTPNEETANPSAVENDPNAGGNHSDSMPIRRRG